jgi:4-nitrophenyl phosphatase
MLSHIENLILDMDGVLWTGNTPMPGLADFFAVLERAKLGFVLATNNASGTASKYRQKLAGFGLEIAEDRILTSAEATAEFLGERYQSGTEVYVVGADGLHEAMTARGYRVITPSEVKRGASAELVVAGFNREVTYDDLAMGALLVHRGAAFYGTNPDPSYPSELGPLPGAGALLSVISTTTGVDPIVIGKPGPAIFRQAVERLGGSKHNTAMVGDRLSTDIAGGANAGLQTILLLSGVSSRADLVDCPTKPDFIFEDIGELTCHLKTGREA